MILELLLLRQAILLIGCGAAAYTDARTGLILDKITYPMIAAGILLDIAGAEFVWLGLGAAVFAAGYALYYFGKLGGGDVKLFTGIALLLPLFQGEFFLLNMLFAACFSAAVFYSSYYVARYARKGISWKENLESVKRAIVFGPMVFAYLLVLVFAGLVGVQVLLVLVPPLAVSFLFLALERGIRKNFFLRNVPIQSLEEDEVIAAEFLDNELKQKLSLKGKGVFGEKEVERLKALGVKEVPVYRNMPPFAPFIFIGCIIALIEPNLISVIFMA